MRQPFFVWKTICCVGDEQSRKRSDYSLRTKKDEERLKPTFKILFLDHKKKEKHWVSKTPKVLIFLYSWGRKEEGCLYLDSRSFCCCFSLYEFQWVLTHPHSPNFRPTGLSIGSQDPKRKLYVDKTGNLKLHKKAYNSNNWTTINTYLCPVLTKPPKHCSTF